jgi:hypothetical protein
MTVIISWEVEGQEPVKITEVFGGFEELSARPFVYYDHRWELYGDSNKYEIFVWTSKTDNRPADSYDSFSIYRSINNGQSWERLVSSSPSYHIAKS